MKTKKLTSILVSILVIGATGLGSHVYGAVLEPPDPDPSSEPPAEPDPEPEPEAEADPEPDSSTPKSKTSTSTTSDTTNYTGDTEEAADTKAPKITDIKVSKLSINSATITWKTNEKASSVVKFGKTKKYGQTEKGKSDTTKHSVTLKGLAKNTTYYFKVKSVDAAGNKAQSKGQIFETKKVNLPGDSDSTTSFDFKKLLLWLGLLVAALLLLFFLWKRTHDKDSRKKKKTTKKRPAPKRR